MTMAKMLWTNTLLGAAVVAMVLLVFSSPASAQAPHAAGQDQKALREEISRLKAQVDRLQATVEKCQTVGCPLAAASDRGAQMAEHGMGSPQGGAMQGGGMMQEHQMGAMGQQPSPAPQAPRGGAMGGPGKPGMDQHMDQMHGVGMGSPPPSAAPPAPPANPPAAMDHM